MIFEINDSFILTNSVLTIHYMGILDLIFECGAGLE